MIHRHKQVLVLDPKRPANSYRLRAFIRHESIPTDFLEIQASIKHSSTAEQQALKKTKDEYKDRMVSYLKEAGDLEKAILNTRHVVPPYIGMTVITQFGVYRILDFSFTWIEGCQPTANYEVQKLDI